MDSVLAKALIKDFLLGPVVNPGVPTPNKAESVDSAIHWEDKFYCCPSNNMRPADYGESLEGNIGFGPTYSYGKDLFTKDRFVGLYYLSTQSFRRQLFGLLPEFNRTRGYHMKPGAELRYNGMPYLRQYTSLRTSIESFPKPDSAYGKLYWKKKTATPYYDASSRNMVSFPFSTITSQVGDGVYHLGNIIGNGELIQEITIPQQAIHIPNMVSPKYEFSSGAIELGGTKLSIPSFWYKVDENGADTYQDFTKLEEDVRAYIVISNIEGITEEQALFQNGMTTSILAAYCKWGSVDYSLGTSRFRLYFPIQNLTAIDKARYDYEKSTKSSYDIARYASVVDGALPNLNKGESVSQWLRAGYSIESAQPHGVYNNRSFDITLEKGVKYSFYLIFKNNLRVQNVPPISYVPIAIKWKAPQITLAP